MSHTADVIHHHHDHRHQQFRWFTLVQDFCSTAVPTFAIFFMHMHQLRSPMHQVHQSLHQLHVTQSMKHLSAAQ